jgi:hypothetical protein
VNKSLQPLAMPTALSATKGEQLRVAVPLRRRPCDLLFIGFFVVNLLLVTYGMDLEQLVIADPAHFHYPIWPVAPIVDLAHWWGHTFDPLQWARPVWWKVTIWIDALCFGPFYMVGTYAFLRAKDWIRLPSILWAGAMLTNVVIILSEEAYGPHATPHLGIVFLANLAWLVIPVALIVRMWRSEKPFTSRGGDASSYT